MLGGWYWGYLLAAITFQFVYPLFSGLPDLGWRVMFWVAIIPALLSAVVLLLVLFACYFAGSLLVPFVLAFILNFLLQPAMRALLEYKAMEKLLRQAALHGPDTVSRIMALLFDSMPHAGAALRLAVAGAGLGHVTGRDASDRAVSLLWDRLDSEDGTAVLGGRDLAEAGEAAWRIAAFLDGMEAERGNPERRKRLGQIRQRMDARCRSRFSHALDADLLAPLRVAGTVRSSAGIMALEGIARSLRRLESAARRIGGSETYDRLLRRTAAEIGSRRTAPGLSLADRVRMVEILAGPDEALALLEAEGG